MESYIDHKMDEMFRKIEQTIAQTRKELEAGLKENKHQILVKVSGMEKKVVEETSENKVLMRRMADKFKEEFE